MTLAPYQPPKLWKFLTEEEDGPSYSYALGKTLNLFARVLLLLLLLALLVASLIVWVWVASFQSGWQFWKWVNEQPDDEPTLALNLAYGSIVLLFSPFMLFLNWSQKQLQQWLNISFPPQINLCKVIEEQLGEKFFDQK